MLPIFLILAVVALVMTPYAIMLVKRHKVVGRIKRIAQKNNFKVKELNRLVFLARNKGREYDLIFVGERTAYAVKLWSTFHTDATLVARSDNSYYVSRRLSEPFEQKGRGDYNFREPKSRLAPTQLSVKLKDGREITPIILVYPRYKAIMRKKGDDVFVFEQGDTLFGKKLYYPEGFERLLVKTGSRSVKSAPAKQQMSVASKESKKRQKM